MLYLLQWQMFIHALHSTDLPNKASFRSILCFTAGKHDIFLLITVKKSQLKPWQLYAIGYHKYLRRAFFLVGVLKQQFPLDGSIRRESPFKEIKSLKLQYKDCKDFLTSSSSRWTSCCWILSSCTSCPTSSPTPSSAQCWRKAITWIVWHLYIHGIFITGGCDQNFIRRSLGSGPHHCLKWNNNYRKKNLKSWNTTLLYSYLK